MSTTEPEPSHGDRTTALIRELRGRGVQRMSLLMRHSAREYAPGRHDLDNPLTESGRALARRFGLNLPPELALRGYASPVPRCEDTADLVHAAHLEIGGRGDGGCRPVEALGVFYVLDQMKMFKAMTAAREGAGDFVGAWLEGRIPVDIMMPAPAAARALLAMLVTRLRTQRTSPALDLCVSHDLTLYLMRHQLLGLAHTAPVLYLDGMVIWEHDGAVFAATPDADASAVTQVLEA